MQKILLTLVVYMFAEIATFILVGKGLGVFGTLLLIIATSVLGIFVIKNKGLKSFQSIKQSIAQGQPPGVAVIEAFMVFIGGVLLIVPGFITDIIGLLMLTSLTRNLFKPLIFYWLRKKMKNSQMIIVQR